MAITQFEATDCRRAMPCWDEPALKANFRVTLVTPPHLRALSNMPVARSSSVMASAEAQRADPNCRGLVVPQGYVRHEFADSPLMSTYLLAFVVSEFDYLSCFSDPVAVPGCRPVELRVYTPTGQTQLGEFALDVARRCLHFYEEYFGVPYPLPKVGDVQ